MNIALIFPKSTFLEKPLTWMPLGLCYIGAQLEKMGHRCEFFDLNEDKMPKDGDFDQIWVSSTSPQIREAKRIGNETSDWKRTKRVLGGAGAWASPDSHKTLPYDLVVGGEADCPENLERILELLDHPTSERYFVAPVARDLSWAVPPIRRWSEKYHSYMADRKTGITHRMSSMFTSRGCGKSCAFCESGRMGVIWDRMVRFESSSVVEAQISEISSQGFTGIGFYDDILPVNKKRTLEILEILKKYGMFWRCFLRTDIICHNGGKEYLEQMRNAGLIEVFIGVESADNKIKEGIHKGTTIEQDNLVIQWCRELEITAKCSLILGLPGESRESMEKTRYWIFRQKPEDVRIQLDRLIPFKGTPLVSHPEEYDLKYENQPDDNWFYQGRHDIGTRSFVSTSHLSVDEIDSFWRNTEKEMEDRGYKK